MVTYGILKSNHIYYRCTQYLFDMNWEDVLECILRCKGVHIADVNSNCWTFSLLESSVVGYSRNFAKGPYDLIIL